MQLVTGLRLRQIALLVMGLIASGGVLAVMGWLGATRNAAAAESATAAIATAEIIPSDRTTMWEPGLATGGGILKRMTIYQTLSPRGGSLDDTQAIQRALDTCPRGQTVKLSSGTFNINGNGLQFRTSDCTLRGSGTGDLGSGKGGTRLVKADRDTNKNSAVIYVGSNASEFSSSVDLAVDAVKDAYSVALVTIPKVAVGDIVLIDQVTDNDPRVWWGPQHEPPGGGTRRWFARQDRSLAQMMEVTAVEGNTLTFSTPFHITYKAKFAAQMSKYANPILHRVGIEDLYVYGGMGGDGHGNVSVSLCAYCWVKNIEAHWSVGTSVGFYGTFRSELRDSYIHETPDPNPGGAGYMVGLCWGASDNLVENNVMWSGNKNIVMRATGGGNVIAYNYMDDAYGSYYPNLPEAGLNAGHYTTPHMELLEGNYSHNYKGDSYWGNSIYITVFRNHFSGLRAARPPLDTYKSGVYPYMDLQGRAAVDIQAHSDYTSFVGNVLGFEGQTLLKYSGLGYRFAQSGWVYEKLDGFPQSSEVLMWSIGSQQAGGWTWVSTTHQTQLREGNWDWLTRTQRWHGIGKEAGYGSPKVIPASLYLTKKPSFFGSHPWPWVHPSNGTTTILPAKACLEQGKMPSCMMQ